MVGINLEARGTMKRPTDPHPAVETLLNGEDDDQPKLATRVQRRASAPSLRRPNTGHGRHASRRGRTSAKFLRRRLMVAAAAVVCVTMVAGISFVSATYFQVVGNLADNTVGRADGTGTEISGWDGAVNILIMGSGSRDGQTSADYGEAGGARSDVMMLLHVSADREDATLISIPRDTMLPTPECTTPEGNIVPAQEAAQINAALENGPFCSLDTIRAFTGLAIDHFIVVGFDGVIGITEAIGGVDVCVENDVADDYSGLYMTAGTHSLQGEAALAFLRTRHGFADGSDLGRIQAQQAFLASLARKVTSAGTLTNPGALYGLADSASKAMTDRRRGARAAQQPRRARPDARERRPQPHRHAAAARRPLLGRLEPSGAPDGGDRRDLRDVAGRPPAVLPGRHGTGCAGPAGPGRPGRCGPAWRSGGCAERAPDAVRRHRRPDGGGHHLRELTQHERDRTERTKCTAHRQKLELRIPIN